MIRHALSFAILFASCAAPVSRVEKIRQENAGKVVNCTDTRDGETFTFRAEKIVSVESGVLFGACFEVICDDWRQRKLCSSYEKTWLKCSVRVAS